MVFNTSQLRKKALEEKIMREVARFPEDKLIELYNTIHYVRLGIEADAQNAISNDNQQQATKSTPREYLLSIAGISDSKDND